LGRQDFVANRRGLEIQNPHLMAGGRQGSGGGLKVKLVVAALGPFLTQFLAACSLWIGRRH
jgi:hypothetical protein